MDKIDYCIDKIDELENRLSNMNNNFSLPCLEFQANFSSEIIDSEKIIVSPEFNSSAGSSLVFQVSVNLELVQADTVNISLLFNGFEILDESFSLSIGKHSLVVMKAADCVSTSSQFLTIKISADGESAHTLEKVDYFIWGANCADESDADISVSYLENSLAISMVICEQLFVAKYDTIPSKIKKSDFVYLMPCKSASICLIKDNNINVLHLFRVDMLKNLNHSIYETFRQEELVAENVDFVATERIRNDKEAIVCFVSSALAKAMFFTDSTFSSAFELQIPKYAVPDRISIIKNSEDRFLICVHTESDAVYLLRSSRERYLPIENINLQIVSSYS